MNFGIEVIPFLLVWLLPFALAVWFIRTLTSMAASLREIAERLATLERAVRDIPPR
jgi:hypothetical protein